MSSGQSKAFRVHYADNHEMTELAGTDVAFHVTVHDVRQRIVPALDDEFAKDMGDFETLDALRRRMRRSRNRGGRGRRAPGARRCAEEARGPCAVPGARLAGRWRNQSTRRRVRTPLDGAANRPAHHQHRLGRLHEAQREPSTEAVGSALVLDEIARRDDIGVSEVEIEAELEKYSARSGLTVPAVRARLEQDGGLERLAAGLRREKALSSRDATGQNRANLRENAAKLGGCPPAGG